MNEKKTKKWIHNTTRMYCVLESNGKKTEDQPKQVWLTSIPCISQVIVRYTYYYEKNKIIIQVEAYK